jgi:ADP-ribose pyrophosphatase YjhB (NUDIX family)
LKNNFFEYLLFSCEAKRMAQYPTFGVPSAALASSTLPSTRVGRTEEIGGGLFTFGSLGGGSGFVSVINPYEAHFNSLNARKALDYGDGFEAVPIWQIRRKTNVFNDEERARSKRLAFTWNPKGSVVKYPQRCPFIWVDNFLFLYRQGMPEPYLLLGRWTKNVEVYGEKTNMDVLALAAGGHYERVGNKARLYDRESGSYVDFEPGDFSLREAADKEIKEETGVDPKLIRATRDFGMMDDVFGDPRCHGLRAAIYLRWVEQAPVASEELKSIVAVPVSQMHHLYNNRVKWRFPDGKELSMAGLGHDRVARYVLTHPETQEFLTLIRTFYEQHPQAAAPVFGQSVVGSAFPNASPALTFN